MWQVAGLGAEVAAGKRRGPDVWCFTREGMMVEEDGMGRMRSMSGGGDEEDEGGGMGRMRRMGRTRMGEA